MNRLARWWRQTSAAPTPPSSSQLMRLLLDVRAAELNNGEHCAEAARLLREGLATGAWSPDERALLLALLAGPEREDSQP